MTRSFRLLSLSGFMIAIVTLISIGCSNGGSSTDSGNSTGTITVLVVDETGKPVAGGEVFTEPGTKTVSVDENGQAVLDDIPIKQYNVQYKRDDTPEFGKFVRLDDVSEQTIQLVIVSALTVTIKDDMDRPVQSTLVSTFPGTEEVTTDNEGKVILHNVPIRQYSFKFERPNLPVVTRSYILSTENINDVEFILDSETPVPEIISPQDNDVFSPYNLTFEGRGVDYEDGDIPDDKLSWRSNFDGELGKGKTLTVESLSIGNHVVTFTAEDSDGKIESTTISVVIVDYDPNSYFPLLENSSWTYRFFTPVFSVINDNNVTEVWNMGSMEVKLDEEMNRKTTITYSISLGAVIENYRYILTDYLEEEDGTIYITNTSESLTIWRPGNEDTPFYRLNNTTTYTPRYTLIKNITEPDIEDHYEIEINAETSWTYFTDNKTWGPYQRYYYLPVNFTIEGSTLVQTDQGILQAVKMQIVTDPDDPQVRNLWFTRGIGIVSMDYDTYGDKQTVILSESNILKYYRAQKSVTGNIVNTPSTGMPVYNLDLDYRTNPIEYMRFLRSFAR